MSRHVHRLQIHRFLAASGEGSKGLALWGAQHPLTWRGGLPRFRTQAGGPLGRSLLHPLLKARSALGADKVVQHVPVSGQFSQQWLGQGMGSRQLRRAMPPLSVTRQDGCCNYSCSPGPGASNSTGSPSKMHTQSLRTWFDISICSALPSPCHPRDPCGHSEQRLQLSEQQSHLDLNGGHWQGRPWTLHLSFPLSPLSGAAGHGSRSLLAEPERRIALTASPWLGGDPELRLGRESPPEC